MPESLNLAPAQWIWWPSQRTLPNTFVLFRKQLEVREGLRRATGWLAADSRYRLFVNGQRIQWGPAISDPRFAEADPLDLTEMLCSGANTLGVEVLYYGHGDGTWPGGKPGLLVRLELEYSDGITELVATDESWLARVDRAHPPAQPKRWYLRALQEEFDARLHPAGWTLPNYQPDAKWLPAMPLTLAPDKPPLASGYWDYLRDWSIAPEACQLLARQVPLLQENAFIPATLRQQGRLRWLRSPDDWFDFRTPDSFTLNCEQVLTEIEPGCYELPAQPADEGVVLVFELSIQSVGWPVFELEAPAGAVCELMTQESHDPEGSPWLDTHFFAWSRFICAEGVNRFEAFEFESFKWVALHIRGATGPLKLREVGLRLRRFPWPNEPKVEVSEPPLQSLFEANVNTLHNCCFDLITDGVGRERQPYSGDAAHSLEALRYTFGEISLPARFLFHYSKGLTPHGYLLDCWPAYDRLERISAKQIGAAFWGPILDHTVQFGFDCWQHWQYSGDLEAAAQGYPALVAFLGYLETSVGSDGLLPVENLGEPYVYLDHQAYRLQRHKQCPYNLYAAAMLKRALAPLATALGELEVAHRATRLGQSLEATTVARFWDPETALFVLNLPWLAEEEGPRLCDRSLASALLFDQCPGDQVDACLNALATRPPELGRCYPPNEVWPLLAQARHRQLSPVLEALRGRWAEMDSVALNGTLQEFWQVSPDSPDEWSHCPMAPLLSLFSGIMGLAPVVPGFDQLRLRPQFGTLASLDVTAYTAKGPLRAQAEPSTGGHLVKLCLPADCEAILELPADFSPLDLPLAGGQSDAPYPVRRYLLPQEFEYFQPADPPQKGLRQ